MSSSMMDTAPGGENTQYESMNTFQKPHNKDGGQMGEQETQTGSTTSSEQQQAKSEKGANTAENIRYGEAISEHGFGGETTGNSGEAKQETGYGPTKMQSEMDDAVQTREVQGYGPGSGVGA